MSIPSPDSNTPVSKCYATFSPVQYHIDPLQHGKRKMPMRAFDAGDFFYMADVLMPEELYEDIALEFAETIFHLIWTRVTMSLSEILDGKFFNEYIKKGNVLMLSEGRNGTDNTYSLKDGVLRLNLDKATYERAGLTGKPVRSGGQKHVKERYVIEHNLRDPSMLHGKKGFERLTTACKEVLPESKNWLFYDLDKYSKRLTDLIETRSGPNAVKTDVIKEAGQKIEIPYTINQKQIEQKYVRDKTAGPQKAFLDTMIEMPGPVPWGMEKIRIPNIVDSCPTASQSAEERVETLEELTATIPEWISLAMLDSERLHENDDIDSYLSRYTVPGFSAQDEVKSDSKKKANTKSKSKSKSNSKKSEQSDAENEIHTQSPSEGGHIGDLYRLHWISFIPPQWLSQLYIQMHTLALKAFTKAKREADSNTNIDELREKYWFVISARTIGKEAVEGKDGVVVLWCPPGDEEVVAGEESEEEIVDFEDEGDEGGRHGDEMNVDEKEEEEEDDDDDQEEKEESKPKKRKTNDGKAADSEADTGKKGGSGGSVVVWEYVSSNPGGGN